MSLRGKVAVQVGRKGVVCLEEKWMMREEWSVDELWFVIIIMNSLLLPLSTPFAIHFIFPHLT